MQFPFGALKAFSTFLSGVKFPTFSSVLKKNPSF